MTFQVDPEALVKYAKVLEDLYTDVWHAKRYTEVHGNFSFGEGGLIGGLFPLHESYMGQLNELHDQLRTILSRSGESLVAMAGRYEETDREAAARIDAGYPESPRSPSRD